MARAATLVTTDARLSGGNHLWCPLEGTLAYTGLESGSFPATGSFVTKTLSGNNLLLNSTPSASATTAAELAIDGANAQTWFCEFYAKAPADADSQIPLFGLPNTAEFPAVGVSFTYGDAGGENVIRIRHPFLDVGTGDLQTADLFSGTTPHHVRAVFVYSGTTWTCYTAVAPEDTGTWAAPVTHGPVTTALDLWGAPTVSINQHWDNSSGSDGTTALTYFGVVNKAWTAQQATDFLTAPEALWGDTGEPVVPRRRIFHPVRRRGGVAAPLLPPISLAAPVFTSAPTISGTLVDTGNLTVTAGSVTGNPAPTSTFQWKRNGTNVSGATGTTYAKSAADIGATITVTQTATNSQGSANSTSAGFGPINDGTAVEEVLATFDIQGTGAPAGTIAIFGSAFPEGVVQPGDPVSFRRNGTTLRTQINPLQTWGDGSVRTFVGAIEMDALANGTLGQYELVHNLAHSSPGADLTWSGATSGRSVAVDFASSGGANPTTWDVLASIDTGETAWMSGPLVICRRARSTVPTSVTGGATDVRAEVDVYCCKDGVISLDWALMNDALHVSTSGEPTYRYSVKIDNTAVFTQGDFMHIHYVHWTRHEFFRKTGGAAVTIPIVMPNADLMRRARVELPMMTDVQFAGEDPVANIVGGTITGPYQNWGLERWEGMQGLRPEMGVRNWAYINWVLAKRPDARKVMMRWAEAVAANRPQALWDKALGRWVNLEDWPKFTWRSPGDNTCPMGTARAEATGFPPGFLPREDGTNYFLINWSHGGTHYAAQALTTGRRRLYDTMAMRACAAALGSDTRQGPSGEGGYGDVWRAAPPNYLDGTGWPGRYWYELREYAWMLRDSADASNLLPDAYPNRAFYDRNMLGYLNTCVAWQSIINTRQGELALTLGAAYDGFWLPSGAEYPAWQGNYLILAAYIALMSRAGGTTARTFFEMVLNARLNLKEHANWRTDWAGNVGQVKAADANGGWIWNTVATYYSQFGTQQPANWLSFGDKEPYADYELSHLASLALAASPDAGALGVSTAIRARAADACVKFLSENAPAPPGSFLWNDQLSLGWGDQVVQSAVQGWAGTSLKWDVAPTIPAGQVITCAANAVNQWIGVIEHRTAWPRATTAEGTNSWTIVSQSAGLNVSVNRGGGVKLNAALTPGQSYTLTVNARTRDRSGVQQVSANQAITITAT